MSINNIKCDKCNNIPNKKFKFETTIRFKFFYYFKLTKQQKKLVNNSSYACVHHEQEEKSLRSQFLYAIGGSISKHLIPSIQDFALVNKYNTDLNYR